MVGLHIVAGDRHRGPGVQADFAKRHLRIGAYIIQALNGWGCLRSLGPVQPGLKPALHAKPGHGEGRWIRADNNQAGLGRIRAANLKRPILPNRLPDMAGGQAVTRLTITNPMCGRAGQAERLEPLGGQVTRQDALNQNLYFGTAQKPDVGPGA